MTINPSQNRVIAANLRVAIDANLQSMDREAAKQEEAQRNRPLMSGLMYMVMPALVFASELALKGILEETGVGYIRTHDLWKNYLRLDLHTQERLQDLWSRTESHFPIKRIFVKASSKPYNYQGQVKENTAEHHGTLRNFLSANRKQYDSWRYPRDAASGLLDIDIPGFMRVLETLTEYKQQRPHTEHPG